MPELPEFEHLKVLCIGDVMLDRFVEGSVKRISPESPVPVMQRGLTRNVPGGAANVCRNLSALGASCTLIGAIGADAAGEELRNLLAECGRIEARLISDPNRQTIEKVRFVAQGQHLLRVDRETLGDLPAKLARAILGSVGDTIPGHNAVILSDYAKGVLTDEVVQGVVDIARRLGIPVIVDPKSTSFARYAGATVVTPNIKELMEATGVPIGDDADAARAAQIALASADLAAVLVTRSERGMSLVERNGPTLHLAASAREVFDVVGAGDTVVAALALCLGAGLVLAAAAHVANAAAGLVVGKHGTATINRTELVDELARLDRAGGTPSQRKVVTAEHAVRLSQQWSRDGLVVGFTNGCFDILHVGHVRILEFANAQCDRLIVAVNDDASVRRLKGPNRPINEELDRAQILGAFGVVDAVVLFGEDTPYDLIAALQPDVLIKGSDYAIENVVGHDIVQRRGGRVVTFELVPDRSTTSTIVRAQTRSDDAP